MIEGVKQIMEIICIFEDYVFNQNKDNNIEMVKNGTLKEMQSASNTHNDNLKKKK